MSHVTKFVPQLPLFRSLDRSLSSVMSCPIFSPSNPFVGPKIHPHPSKYLPKHVFFEFPALKIGGWVSLFPIEEPPNSRGWGGQRVHYHLCLYTGSHVVPIWPSYWGPCARESCFQARSAFLDKWSCKTLRPRYGALLEAILCEGGLLNAKGGVEKSQNAPPPPIHLGPKLHFPFNFELQRHSWVPAASGLVRVGVMSTAVVHAQGHLRVPSPRTYCSAGVGRQAPWDV